MTLATILACPACKRPIHIDADLCTCENTACGKTFPILRGIPVLIHDKNSVFSIHDYAATNSAKTPAIRSLLRRISERVVPSITHNWVGQGNYRLLASALHVNQHSNVLVVGAGELGVGFDFLLHDPSITLVETDVYFAPRIAAIADCHDLPFLDRTFDAVIVQAVLEHVADPARCVAEIHRVLKDSGYVYAETPFLFPVHLGPYDFTRFTRNGHRRLFRHFDEVASGMASGPATALNLAIRSLFLSLSTSRWMALFARNALPFFIFWIKYFDYWLIKKPQAADFAAAFFFIGKKRGIPLRDREIVNMHWTRRSL